MLSLDPGKQKEKECIFFVSIKVDEDPVGVIRSMMNLICESKLKKNSSYLIN